MGAGLLPSTQGESDHSRAAQERISVTSSRSNIAGLPVWPADTKRKNVLLEFGDTQVVRSAFMRRRLDTFIAAGNLLGP